MTLEYNIFWIFHKDFMCNIFSSFNIIPQIMSGCTNSKISQFTKYFRKVYSFLFFECILSYTTRAYKYRSMYFNRSISIKRIVCLCLSLSVSVSVCLNAFAQFSSYEIQTSQERQGLPGTGRGGVDDSTVPLEGSEMKG